MAMKKVIQALLIGVVCVCPALVQAQGARVIQGTVKLGDDPELFMEASINGPFNCFVYSFDNEEEAIRNLNDFKANKFRAGGVPRLDYRAVKKVVLADINPSVGFSIEAVTDGFILTLVDKENFEVSGKPRRVTRNMSPPVFTVVKKKVAEKTGDMSKDTQNLDGVEVVGERKKGTAVAARTVEEDGRLFLRIEDLPHPCRSRTNSRIIIQPYWLDGPDMGENKVFSYAAPVVYDYAEYDCTQSRRMNFNKEANDKLGRFIVNDHTPVRVEVKNDSIRLRHYIDTLSGHNPDEAYPYPARAIIAVEDYNERYVLDTIHIDEGERTNYIKFLDFSYEKDIDVNLEDFREEMVAVPLDSKGEVKLNFEVGKATLNPRDTTNTRILTGARRELQEAFKQSSSKLRFMQVFGYSSPEGNEASNRDLARRRAEFVKSELAAVIPSSMRSKIRDSESEILGWDVVADSLEKDGLVEEARQVKEIVDMFPGNLSAQGQAVARLSSYATIIKPIYLPKLRTVRYEYTKVEDRTLTNEELVQYFDEGKDDDPEVGFNRANYFHLIRYYWPTRKTPEGRARLEQIAKRALVNTRLTEDDLAEGETLNNEGYWALAANILAMTYIERDTFDLDILRPFIDRTKEIDPETKTERFARPLRLTDYKYDHNDQVIGITGFTNHPEMIAEQMIMLLMQPGRKHIEELSDLTNMIEFDEKCMSTPTYSMMLALANCKRGYYRGDDARAVRTRAAVSEVSLTNNVIMNIAQADAEGDEAARAELMEQIYDLPETSIAYYLKAIIELLRPAPDMSQAAEYLANSFKMDLRKMPVANNDQQLIYNREKIVPSAFTKWEGMMKNEVHKKTFDKESFELSGIDSLQIAAWKQQGVLDGMLSDYWIVTTDESHPYYWYEKAIAARLSEDEGEVVRNLEKCIAINPDYLAVIGLARYADEEVKASKKVTRLFERFYLNEMRKKE